jgi:hypothetical protein
MAYQTPIDPWAHQKAALKKMKGHEAFALLMEMRTGKTKVTLDDFGRMELSGEVDAFLLIAPAGVYLSWIEAMEQHLSVDLKSRALIFIWQSGPSAAKKRELALFLRHEGPKVLLMNVEAFSTVKAAQELAVDFCKQNDVYGAIDESTCIKNASSKRSKFVVNILRPLIPIRRILSGLPTPRSPLDAFAQYAFLDWHIIGFKSYFSFRARYGIMVPMELGGRWVKVVTGYKNTDELQENIAPYSYRKLLKECYDVPDKVYLRHDVQLHPDQKRIYGEMKKFATAELDALTFVSAQIVITQMLRLHQILCGNTKDEKGNDVAIPEYRTRDLLQTLEEHQGKVIIWCTYDANIRSISEKLKKEYGEGSVARFWGGNVKTREAEEKAFKSDPDCRFMVATPAAGGRGRTWLVADLVIYFSSTSNLEHRAQSEERAQGIGKDEHVTYIDMIAPGTIEGKFLQSLRDKIDLAGQITGDDYREWLI